MEKILIPLNEACSITGLSKSTIYKLTANRSISFYKPFGKKIFFSREQLEKMMTRKLLVSKEELEKQATDLLTTKNVRDGGRSNSQ